MSNKIGKPEQGLARCGGLLLIGCSVDRAPTRHVHRTDGHRAEQENHWCHEAVGEVGVCSCNVRLGALQVNSRNKAKRVSCSE
jgi:hypothetical protein